MSDTIPSLSFEELPSAIAVRLKAKYERLGYLGDFFARTAHQPEALGAFIDFTEFSKGALNQKTVELIALTVATLKDIAYEKHQHERLSVKLGYGEDWVRDIEALTPEQTTHLSHKETVVQRFVIDAVNKNGVDVSRELDKVVIELGCKNSIAVLFVMARYVAHALMINSLNIESPVPSIFED